MKCQIQKTIHIIWIGDDTKKPIENINSWIHQNPSWTVHLWGNKELAEHQWINYQHISTFLTKKSARYLSGISDIMRYEILHEYGGLYVDADTICLRPLEDWLFDSSFCASWESERVRPGLIASSYIYATPHNPIVLDVIRAIKRRRHITNEDTWKTTGPRLLTHIFNASTYQDYTLWTSHYFIPQHFDNSEYSGTGHVFAHQEWTSTRTVPPMKKHFALASKNFFESIKHFFLTLFTR